MARFVQILQTPDIARPVLHLSGPKLRAALENLIRAAEAAGGVEAYAGAVRLKSQVFQDRLADGRARALTRATFDELLPLMPTVRRRIGAVIVPLGWPRLHAAIIDLLDNATVPGTADMRVAKFEKCLTAPPRRPPTPSPCPQGGGESTPSPHVGEGRRGGESLLSQLRCLRDLAAELLHAVYPEHYPLMTRWVWDAAANTGVLREIWHDPVSDTDEVDRIVIDVPDTHETFLVLREELSQFVADNGVFRDVLWYVDLLLAQIYGDYINAQGGAYLKTDFSAGPDLLEQSRRILGLDLRKGVRSRDRAFVKSG
jgi:hypothetical protein